MSPVLFIVLVILVIFTIKYVFGNSESNPFAKDCREPLKKKVYDKKKNKVLKQGEFIYEKTFWKLKSFIWKRK